MRTVLTPLAFLLLSATQAIAITFTTLDDPSAGQGYNQGTLAYGISDTTITGYYSDSSTNYHGFLYNGSSFTTLNDPLGVGGTFAAGNSGTNVVGDYIPSAGAYQGFIYNGSSYTTLDDPSAGTGANQGTFLLGISGPNIVGKYYDSSGLHAFVYNGSSFTTLNDPSAGAIGMVANAISDTDIVGTYYDASGTAHGFLYDGSSYTTLNDPLAGTGQIGEVNLGTEVYGISGTNIVGVYYDSSGLGHGFIYNGSSYTTLDDPLGVDGTVAYGISGNEIVGIYYSAVPGFGGSFLATVPEPSSLLLLVIGSIGFAALIGIEARRRLLRTRSLASSSI